MQNEEFYSQLKRVRHEGKYIVEEYELNKA